MNDDTMMLVLGFYDMCNRKLPEAIIPIVFKPLERYKYSEIEREIYSILTKTERLPENPLHAILKELNPMPTPEALIKSMEDKMNRDGNVHNYTDLELGFYAVCGGQMLEFRNMSLKDKTYKAKSYLERL